MTCWRLHYHLIWATFEREPGITPEREKIFYGVLYNKAEVLGVKIHAAGNIEDHVHVVASIPPKLAVADCVRQLKGASSYAINQMDGSNGKFKWQEGYGALVLAKSHWKQSKSMPQNKRNIIAEIRLMRCTRGRKRMTRKAEHAGWSGPCCGCSMS